MVPDISTSEIKPSDPKPSYQRKYDLNKNPMTQHGTYLDLTRVVFKDQLKIDDWAQSMSI